MQFETKNSVRKGQGLLYPSGSNQSVSLARTDHPGSPFSKQ